MRKALLFVAIVAAAFGLRVPAAAAAACPDCLEKALVEHADKTYTFIRTAWQRYREAARLLQQIEATGTPDQIAMARQEHQRLRGIWQRAELTAKAYADPSFAAFLERRRDRLARRLEDERARLHKRVEFEARLLKATLGPQRAGLIRDIAGYERESARLEQMARHDAFLFGLSFAELGLSRVLQSADKEMVAAIRSKVPAQVSSDELEKVVSLRTAQSLMLNGVRAMNETAKAGAAGVGMMAEGKHLQQAVNEDRQLEAFAAGLRLASEGSLRFTRLVIESPGRAAFLTVPEGAIGAAAVKGTLWLNVAALSLDTVLVSAAVRRLDQANARLDALETTESAMRGRIQLAVENETVREKRIHVQDRVIADRKVIADFYEQTRREQP